MEVSQAIPVLCLSKMRRPLGGFYVADVMMWRRFESSSTDASISSLRTEMLSTFTPMGMFFSAA